MDQFFCDLLHLLECASIHHIRAHITKIPRKDIERTNIPIKKISIKTIERNDVEIFQLVIQWGFYYLFGDRSYRTIEYTDNYFVQFVEALIKYNPSRIDSIILYNNIYRLVNSSEPSYFRSILTIWNYEETNFMEGRAIGMLIRTCDLKTLHRIVIDVNKTSQGLNYYRRIRDYSGTEIVILRNRINNICCRRDFDELESLGEVIFEYIYHSTPIKLICSDVVLHTPQLINIVIMFATKNFPKGLVMNLLTQGLRDLFVPDVNVMRVNAILSYLSEDLYKEIFAKYRVGDDKLFRGINLLYRESLVNQSYRNLRFVLCFLKYFGRDLEEDMREFTVRFQDRKQLVLLAFEKEYLQRCFFQSMSKADYLFFANLQEKQLRILKPFFYFLDEQCLINIISEYVGIEKMFL
ncbi:MAG: hypothetical protein Hyperionvirus5_45 [Hyperionvirus sp.]|uniref:Uncharacterized protein n=1 Tax=Hyperionvirus sp. TaxID=2487770 RepID=A0A3G5AD03_9VIRU|nr:MAG: hypothetical protein Hyperionvirus5_45 [Hyperionvirus sp.]